MSKRKTFTNSITQNHVPKYEHEQLQKKNNELQWVIVELKGIIAERERKILQLVDKLKEREENPTKVGGFKKL